VAPVPAAAVANDVIALRDDRPYLDWMEAQWPGLVGRRQLRRWIAEGQPELLSQAAMLARAEGRLAYTKLGELLEAVERPDADTIRVNSLLPLAAWALARSWDTGLNVSVCAECGNPWLSRQPVDFCYRPAPNRTTTCAGVHAHTRFAEQRAAWNKEYRKVYNRKHRGTVAERDWRQWLAEATWLRKNANGFVLPFDYWAALKQPTSQELAQLRRALAKEWGEQEVDRITELQTQTHPQTISPLLDALVKHLQQPS
jgi:hypothetical protein